MHTLIIASSDLIVDCWLFEKTRVNGFAFPKPPETILPAISEPPKHLYLFRINGLTRKVAVIVQKKRKKKGLERINDWVTL